MKKKAVLALLLSMTTFSTLSTNVLATPMIDSNISSMEIDENPLSSDTVLDTPNSNMASDTSDMRTYSESSNSDLLNQQNNTRTIATGRWNYTNGNWSYIDSEGRTKTGWYLVNNVYYYSNEHGIMQSDKWIGNYYVTSDGSMATDTWIGNYYVDSTGLWIPGKVLNISKWVSEGNTWYYYDADGKMATGWRAIGGAWYYFNPNGSMATGWQLIGDTWYYLNSNGSMATGWQLIGGAWYYLNPNGSMATGWQLLGGTWYYLNPNGNMATGWGHINGVWYYLNPNGSMATGWQHIGGTWYYLNSDGSMATGWLTLSSGKYYLKPSGDMVTGWLDLDGTRYYMDTSGSMVTNKWINDSFIGNDGKMATSSWVDNGQHYVDENGLLDPNKTADETNEDNTTPDVYDGSGWKAKDGLWYYQNNGKQITGWIKVNGNRYYLNEPTGEMRTGWFSYKGNKYYFNPSGALVSGWIRWDQAWYYSDASGRMLTNRWIENYYVGADGKMATYCWVDNDKYFVDENGVWDQSKKPAIDQATPTAYDGSGWVIKNNSWYYYHSGKQITGWIECNGVRYYLDKSTGKMKTGWLTYDGEEYYFDASGAMKKFWFVAEDGWYYANAFGQKLTSTWIGEYYITSSGKMATGSVTIGDKTYIFDSSGKLLSADRATLEKGKQIAAFAKQFEGNPYVNGGTSLTNGADCSGFVMSVMANFNIKILRVADAQAAGPTQKQINEGYAKGVAVTEATMIPGDLVFYSNGGVIDHVGLYIGDGKIIHASTSKTGIKISPYNYKTPAKIMRYF